MCQFQIRCPTFYYCQNWAEEPKIPSSQFSSGLVNGSCDRWSFLFAQFMHRRGIDFNLLHGASMDSQKFINTFSAGDQNFILQPALAANNIFVKPFQDF